MDSFKESLNMKTLYVAMAFWHDKESNPSSFKIKRNGKAQEAHIYWNCKRHKNLSVSLPLQSKVVVMCWLDFGQVDRPKFKLKQYSAFSCFYC